MPDGALLDGVALFGIVGAKDVVDMAAAAGEAIGPAGAATSELVGVTGAEAAGAAEADCVEVSFHMVMPTTARSTNPNMLI